ncbi:nucleotidyltransferase family protein [Yoonia sediminilitoris]|uniref:MurNAc alpha-1-phosphate uridylyltransferase n=1 Tax=Yoonia sediminilitoris TaxID=1286148 RepID=A0A2T6KM10_9RHOB|nr:nucleotidyltransferase family protein [Yoonia sediminilitoris]PUB17197.1 MurNAc alpha-1-phosphate uridylyltransferase [Yoonia sediminilitoris]RCW97492.1 MurNAc alpha-1-phosphate uridylyltransferase [Yoonia sediminilitoris]
MSWPILFFAAGLGTRMGELTKDKPKPLVEVAGRALIDHALGFAETPGIGPRVVNLHYKGAMIRDHLSQENVLFSDESEALLETGGGLRHALPHLAQSPVITMNTDAVWKGPNPIAQVIAAWRDDMECLLLMVPRSQVSGHLGEGDFTIDDAGRLHRGKGDIYSGVQIIRTETLADIKESRFSMNIVWDQVAARGGLFGVRYSGQWCDVGQPSSIAIAQSMLHV